MDRFMESIRATKSRGHLREAYNKKSMGKTESLNTGVLGAKIGDKIKDTKTGKIGEVKKIGQSGNNDLIYVDFGNGLRKINPMDDAQVEGRYEIVLDESVDKSTLTEASMSRNDLIDEIEKVYNSESGDKVDDAIKSLGYNLSDLDDSDEDEGFYSNFSDDELRKIYDMIGSTYHKTVEIIKDALRANGFRLEDRDLGYDARIVFNAYKDEKDYQIQIYEI